jgi:putative hemolysin
MAGKKPIFNRFFVTRPSPFANKRPLHDVMVSTTKRHARTVIRCEGLIMRLGTTMSVTIECMVIIFLLIINGFFAMSELAVVSSRRPLLTALAERGNRGAQAALRLLESPGRFLSSVQIGITLVGVLAGAFGGATLAEHIEAYLAQFAILAEYAEAASVAIVVAAITYLSLIIGELVPKHIALSNPERIAAWVSRPMTVLARVAAPVVWLLDVSTHSVLRLLGRQEIQEKVVTEEEVRAVIREGGQAGVLHPEEQEMLGRVMRLADLRAKALMTPRPELQWLNVNSTLDELKTQMLNTSHSRFIVATDEIDSLMGIVPAKAVLDQCLKGQPIALKKLLEEAPVVIETTPALAVIQALRRSPIHMALVVDEYGGIAGVISTTDVLAAIVGSMVDQDAVELKVVQRDDGSWLVDGDLAADIAWESMPLPNRDADATYTTVAGFVLANLQRIPTAGDHFIWKDFRVEVVDMDERRVDKVLITRQAQPVINTNETPSSTQTEVV